MTKKIEWIDGCDPIGAGLTSTMKETGNLAQGGSTLGIYEYIVYVDDLIYGCWTGVAATNNMGLCTGLVATALLSKAIFMPFQLYG